MTRDLCHLFKIANRRKRRAREQRDRARAALAKLNREHSALLIENDRLGQRFRDYIATHPDVFTTPEYRERHASPSAGEGA